MITQWLESDIDVMKEGGGPEIGPVSVLDSSGKNGTAEEAVSGKREAVRAGVSEALAVLL